MARYEARLCCGLEAHGWGVMDKDSDDWAVPTMVAGRLRREPEARAMAAALNGMGTKDLEICGNAMRGIADAAREEIEWLRNELAWLTNHKNEILRNLVESNRALEETRRDTVQAEAAESAAVRERDEARAERDRLRAKGNDVLGDVLARLGLPGGWGADDLVASVKATRTCNDVLRRESAEMRSELADARGALARWRQAAKEMLSDVEKAPKPVEKCGARHPRYGGELVCAKAAGHDDGWHDSEPGNLVRGETWRDS